MTVGEDGQRGDVIDVPPCYPAIPRQRGESRHRLLEAPVESRSGTAVFRAALVLAFAVMLGAPAGAIAFATARQHERPALVSGQGQDLGLWNAPAADAAGHPNARAGAGQTTAPVATPNAPPTSLDGRINRVLQDQASALLNGDEAGFLRAVDPSARGLRADLARRYGSLRKLQVKVWQPAAETAARTEDGGTARVTVLVQYCYVVTTCEPMNLEADTRWKVGGSGVTLLEFGTAKVLGPRPWEVSDLRTAIGDRVVMSTTAKYADRLPSMLAAAEQAAALTDQYARWGPPPSRYVVYLAGPEEWAAWYGMAQEPWVIGFALPLTASATEIVLNAAQVDTQGTLDVLRHEFTHVVTLSGVEKSWAHTWWLVEGIAEYVRVKGTGKPFDSLPDVRKYVHGGDWKGEIDLDDPPGDATTADVSARYGIAYLTLQHLADRFGEAKLLNFFKYAVRDGRSLDAAARKAFGVRWNDLQNDCARYVRDHV
ncbi:basic secretory protein-like protein [Dactylosporangium sp. CS-047395]|uniref:basic secretory protein-like protein n=1 Tax=Dactylosporangium sp. CS-047395 TaxID=3239936 RepID=UPI003D89E164